MKTPGQVESAMRRIVEVDGVVRFEANPIVRTLVDRARVGKCDLNDLAIMDFPQAAWEEFYQLIGYSVNGYCDLNVSDESVEKALAIAATIPRCDR